MREEGGGKQGRWHPQDLPLPTVVTRQHAALLIHHHCQACSAFPQLAVPGPHLSRRRRKKKEKDEERDAGAAATTTTTTSIVHNKELGDRAEGLIRNHLDARLFTYTAPVYLYRLIYYMYECSNLSLPAGG